MIKDDKNDVAAGLHNATRMRKPELKMELAYKLAEHDFVDNGRKSLDNFLLRMKHVRAFFPDDRSASRITTGNVEEYKAWRRGQGASQSTVNGELSLLSLCYTVVVRKGMFDQSYVPHITYYRIGNQNRRKGFFERSEYERFLTTLPEHFRDIVSFMFICGWRGKEVRGLRWDENYIEDEQAIRIYDSKNGDWRLLPLTDEEGELNDLGVLIAERLQKRLADCPYIFHYKGKEFNRSTYYFHWKRARAALGSSRMPHDFRRTASRNLRNKGVDAADRMAIIGHRTISMDLRYGIVNKADMQRALRKVSFASKTQIKPTDNQVQRETAQVTDVVTSAQAEDTAESAFISANLQEVPLSPIKPSENLAEGTPSCDEHYVQVDELTHGYKAAVEWAGRLLAFFTGRRSK